MRGALEDGHVRSQLGDDRRCDDAIDAGDDRQAGVVLAVGCELDVDGLVELRNVLVELLQAGELHLENEAMAFLDTSF